MNYEMIMPREVKIGDRIVFFYNDRIRNIKIENITSAADGRDTMPNLIGRDKWAGSEYRCFNSSKIQGTIERRG